MIERIYIRTVRRVDNQITYNNLPDELKSKVIMVVQEWEREEYNYDCEYLILPKHITLDFPKALTMTSEIIYHHAKNIKYAMLDDDITFSRRNAKYWTGESNMEKSKRKCTDEDIIEMFKMFDEWLDESEVTFCGCGFSRPPSEVHYMKNQSLSSAFWIDGRKLSKILSELDLTYTRVAQDVVFILSLLTRGHGNRVSNEFLFNNVSTTKKSMKSEQWDNQKIEDTLKDHREIEKRFPGIFKVLYDAEGRIAGGFRNQGKSKIYWKKAYESSKHSKLFN